MRTLEVEQSNLISYLRWCYRKGYMRTPPAIRPIIKNPNWIHNHKLVDHNRPERRDLVSPEVYATYREYLRHTPTLRPRDTYESDYHLVSRRRLHFYLISIYNLCCRAGEEILKTKFKDFQLVPSERREGAFYVVMTTTHGKKVTKHKYGGVKKLLYYSDYDYANYFNTWKTLLQEKGFPTGPDDWVFPVRKRKGKSKYHRDYESYNDHEGNYVPFTSQASQKQIRRLGEPIKNYLRDKDRLSERMVREIDFFTAYSVRHLAIRQLIVASGFTMGQVAEKCQTSISMIEDFYYRYGQNPEDRLVSRHPQPSASNTPTLNSDVVASLSETIKVNDAKGKGRNYD